jgi:hypothetical protein
MSEINQFIKKGVLFWLTDLEFLVHDDDATHNGHRCDSTHHFTTSPHGQDKKKKKEEKNFLQMQAPSNQRPPAGPNLLVYTMSQKHYTEV